MTEFSFMGEQTQRLIKRIVLTCLGDSTDVSSVICLLLGTTVDALELLLESDVSDMDHKESENSKESESIKITNIVLTNTRIRNMKLLFVYFECLTILSNLITQTSVKTVSTTLPAVPKLFNRFELL